MGKLLATVLLVSGMCLGQAAYNMDRDTGIIKVSGGTFTHQNRIGALNITVEEIVNGSPASLTITIQGCGRGNLASYGLGAGSNGLPTASPTCDTLDTYNGLTNANRKVTGLYDNYVVSASFSGGSSPSVQLNVIETAASAPLASQQPAVTFFPSVTVAANVKTSAGALFGWMLANPNASACFIQVFNVPAASVVLGSTVPIMAIPLSASGNQINPPVTIGAGNFSTAISIAATTTANGGTTCAAGVPATIWFQ